MNLNDRKIKKYMPSPVNIEFHRGIHVQYYLPICCTVCSNHAIIYTPLVIRYGKFWWKM